MSSLFHCVADTIARCIVAATKPRGGGMPGVDPTVTARALWLDTHRLANASDKTLELTSIAAVGTDNQSAVATAACDDGNRPVRIPG